MDQISGREEVILAHTNLLSLHLSTPENYAAAAAAAAASASNTAAAASTASASASHVSSPSSSVVVSPSVLALQNQIAAYLPSREWFRIPMHLDPATAQISHFTLQHGTSMPQLTVRVLHQHVMCHENEQRARELDLGLQWLMESISIGSSYPVLGVDCESDCSIDSDGEVRLLQLSTGTRCLLIRLPPQPVIRQVCEMFALEKQIAAASAVGSAATTVQPASPLFTPFFHSLLANRSIFKSGAELWTDSLDLWACTPGAEMNSCLNMSWIYRNEHGGALSLANMVNMSLATDGSFLKDKATTTSEWGSRQLSLRQLVYAALDAQASFIAGANQSQIPKPFHVTDMPRSWLSRASKWKAIMRAEKIAREANNRFNPYDPANDTIVDAAHRYFAQYMQGEEPFNPFVALLLHTPFPAPAAAAASMPPPNARLIPQPSTRNIAPWSNSYFHGEDLAVETSNVQWWFMANMEPNLLSGSNVPQPVLPPTIQPAPTYIGDALDRSRVCVVQGAAGSGLTMSCALEAWRSLHRSSTLSLDHPHAPAEMRSTPQRVIMLAENEYAARALADAVAQLAPPSEMMLLLSPTFLQVWQDEHPNEFPRLRSGYLVSEQSDADRSILICTIDHALTTNQTWKLRNRQTVLVDDASQVWLLKLVLLLRKLPHTERLILYGDSTAHIADLAGMQVEDCLNSPIAALRSGFCARVPPPFRVQRIVLRNQWRLPPHLLATLNDTFYGGKLLPDENNANRARAVGWVDLRSISALNSNQTHKPASPQTDISTPTLECDAIRALWTHFTTVRQLQPERIAILVLNEIHRSALLSLQSLGVPARTFTPEQFQGRQAEVVLLLLSPVIVPPRQYGNSSYTAKDQVEAEKRRILAACSRASSKLFLVGDRTSFTSPSSPHASSILQNICDFELKEMEEIFPDLAVNLEASFPALSSVNATATSSSSSSPALAPKDSSNMPKPSEISQIQAQAQWGGGTLSFKAAAPGSEKKPTAAQAAAAGALAAAAVDSPSLESRNKKAAAAEPPSSKKPTAPAFVFEPMPDNRAFKVLPCDKLHAVDGRRPSMTCHNGDKCGFLHSEWWARSPRTFTDGRAEYWLLNPGSRTILVETVENWNDRRWKQMEGLVDSKLNRIAREKQWKEVAHLFPDESTDKQKQVNGDEENTVAPTAPSTAASKSAATKTAAVVSTPVKPTAAAVASTPFSATSLTAAKESPAPFATPTTAASIVDASEEAFRRAGASASTKRVGRKSKIVPAREEYVEPPAPQPLREEDDFVPVSRRHASKHPSSLAASLAAEFRASEAASAVVSQSKEVEEEEEAERERERAREREREAAEKATSKNRRPSNSTSNKNNNGGSKEDSAEDSDDSDSEKKVAGKKVKVEVAVDYPSDMAAGTWWSVEDLASLSKNARKKLLWLCPACRAPNVNGDAKCSLCSGPKPAPAAIRYSKPPGTLIGLPREVEGKYAYESEWVRLVSYNPSTSSTAGGVGGGAVPSFVAAKNIPAGTIILREDAMYSELQAGGKGPLGLVPPPRACAQVAAQLLQDPVQMALLRSRWNASPWTEAQLKVFLRAAESASGVPSLKPKDAKDWGMAMAYASTAKYAREETESHNSDPSCRCHRFKLARQSSILIPSCWPNTAVVCLHTDPMLTADQMAILAVTDIPAGTPLTNVTDQALLNLPSDRRQQTISLAKYRATGRSCFCDRCQGKVAQEQEKLLLSEIPGFSIDKARITAEYDKIMIAYSETQHSKTKIKKGGAVADNEVKEDKVKADGKSSGSLSESDYYYLCYHFLNRSFDFITSHPLHMCHWRMQKVRELYLSLVRCDYLYRLDYMVLSGITDVDKQHAILRQIVHVLDVAIRSDQTYFREMEPMRSLPLLTLLELCTFLIQNKVTIRPGNKASKNADAEKAGSNKNSKVWKVECLEFEGIGRFDSQAAFLLNLSQLNQYAALIRTLNFPFRRYPPSSLPPAK